MSELHALILPKNKYLIISDVYQAFSLLTNNVNMDNYELTLPDHEDYSDKIFFVFEKLNILIRTL